MKDYEKAVRAFADGKENFQFTNKGKKHASIVIANLLRTSKSECRIYSGKLNSDVTNDSFLVKALNEFLESDKQLYLMLDEMPDNKSEALKQILNATKNKKRNVSVKIDSEGVFSKQIAPVFEDNVSHHFIVSDSLSYRFEIDAHEFKAICNFNDPNTSNILKTAFDTYFFSK